MENGIEIDHRDGDIPYSSGRIRSILRRSGINNPLQNEKREFYWNEWVEKQIEEATRKIVSERNLDNMWRPQNDGRGVSAFEEMSELIKKILVTKLLEVGINLYRTQIINYDLQNRNLIVNQNISSWCSYWEQQIANTNSEIESIIHNEIEKAKIFSRSLLLNTIADSISQAYQIREDLPRHLITHYYFHILKEHIKSNSSKNVPETKQILNNIWTFLEDNQREGDE